MHFRMSIREGILVMVLGLPPAHAQQQSDGRATQPVPALPSPLASAADNGNAEDLNVDPQKLSPDTRALSGARGLSLGVPTLRHSSWRPYFNLSSMLDTNAPTTNQPSGFTTWTSLYGGIDLHRASGRSDMNLNYLGGALISNDSIASKSLIQQLELDEKLSWRRSVLLFFDQLSYLPEAAFGFDVPSGVNLPVGQELSIQPALTPDQSILTTRGRRISNTFLAEVDTFLTPRSSLTFVGSYSVLRFLDNSFLNSGATVVQAGYNHKTSREDTIGLLYRVAAFQYSNFDQSIDTHTVQVSYGRHVTGQMAFQVAVGPGVGFFRTPISTGTTSSTQANWTLDSSLTYQLRRTQFGFAYHHSLAGGAGVLAGAVNDQASGSISSQLSRTFRGGFVLGYARNQGLNIATPAPSNQSYNSWFSRVNLARSLGRETNLFLNYRMQFQNSSTAFCVGTTCGKSLVRHTLSLGLDWRSQPIPIG